MSDDVKPFTLPMLGEIMVVKNGEETLLFRNGLNLALVGDGLARLLATARAGLAAVTDEEVARFTQRLERALRSEPFDAATDDFNPSLIRQFLDDFIAGRTRSGLQSKDSQEKP